MQMPRFVIKLFIASAIVAITLIPITQAAELDTMFDEIGAYGNITGPAVYRGQTMNMYTGGSVFMRTPVRNYQMVSMEAPYMRTGCGGIDIHAGSFSHINKDQLTAMFKNIGSNAIGYAFTLALGTICPDCKNGIQWMNTLASEVNRLNINSCEAAKGLMPANFKNTMETIRSSAAASWGRVSNAFEDQAEASRQTKGDNVNTVTQLKAMRTADPRLAAVDPKGNIVWRALKNMPDLTDDQRLVLMSFVGTVIIKEDPDTGVITPEYIPAAKISLQDVLGTPGQPITTITGIGCLDNLTDCEQVRTDYPIVIADQSIRYRVNQVVWDFVNSIYNSTSPQTTSISFLGSISLPLYKMVSVAMMTGNYMQLLRDSVEVTAMEIASSYLDYVADTLDKMLANHHIMGDAAQREAVGKLFNNVRQIREDVVAKKQIAYKEILNRLALVDQMKTYERDMLASIPARLGRSVAATATR